VEDEEWFPICIMGEDCDGVVRMCTHFCVEDSFGKKGRMRTATWTQDEFGSVESDGSFEC